MAAQRIILLLAALTLSACAAVNAPLQPVLKAKVKTIELAKIETHKLLLIRQVNPAVAIMGTSGLVMDAAILTQRAHEYEQAAGPVNQLSIETFKNTLLGALSKQGFKVSASGKGYWDYFNGKRKSQASSIDSILNIEFKHLGFWSQGLIYPYRPALFIMAELVDPVTRKVLYSDRFAMGIDITSLQVMTLAYGTINIVPTKQKSSYSNFNKLVHRPEQSRNALLKVVKKAARHIAKSLHGDKRSITRTYAQTAARVQQATSNKLVVESNVANIRKRPDTRSKVIHKLKKGDVVTKMRKQKEWYYILLQDGRYAWAHQSVFIKPLKDETIDIQVRPKNHRTVAVDVANIRKKPDTRSEIIGKLKRGDTVVKMREQNGWVYIRLEDGTFAWVHQSIFPDIYFTPPPKSRPAGSSTARATRGSLTIMANIANIRNRPDTRSKIIARLKRGEQVVKLKKQGDWFQIILKDDTTAWAHQSVF